MKKAVLSIGVLGVVVFSHARLTMPNLDLAQKVLLEFMVFMASMLVIVSLWTMNKISQKWSTLLTVGSFFLISIRFLIIAATVIAIMASCTVSRGSGCPGQGSGLGYVGYK